MGALKQKIRLYLNMKKQKLSVFGFGIDVDWVIVVLVAAIFILVIFVNKLNTFNQILSGEIYEIGDTTQTFSDSETIRKIDEVLDRFEGRK